MRETAQGGMSRTGQADGRTGSDVIPACASGTVPRTQLPVRMADGRAALAPPLQRRHRRSYQRRASSVFNELTLQPLEAYATAWLCSDTARATSGQGSDASAAQPPCEPSRPAHPPH